MRNDRVLIPVLHVAHDAKCFFALCILALLSTTIGQLYFITKITTFGLYEYKVEGSCCGFNRNRGLAETDSYFITRFGMF